MAEAYLAPTDAVAEYYDDDGYDDDGYAETNNQYAVATTTADADFGSLFRTQGGTVWDELYDEESGHPYYVDRTTGETAWELPHAPATLAAASDALALEAPLEADEEDDELEAALALIEAAEAEAEAAGDDDLAVAAEMAKQEAALTAKKRDNEVRAAADAEAAEAAALEARRIAANPPLVKQMSKMDQANLLAKTTNDDEDEDQAAVRQALHEEAEALRSLIATRFASHIINTTVVNVTRVEFERRRLAHKAAQKKLGKEVRAVAGSLLGRRSF